MGWLMMAVPVCVLLAMRIIAMRIIEVGWIDFLTEVMTMLIICALVACFVSGLFMVLGK